LSDERVILCVDDDSTGLTVRRLLLSVAGYTVLTATDARLALKLLACNHVDLVITDHLLPDVTEAEIVSEVKRLKPEVPVVLLTGLAEPPSGFEQADLLLSKGIVPQEFLSEIARLLSSPQSASARLA
jgi:CheY-like chemotaxis protein